MRTFHTGGVGVFAEQGTKLFVAPFQGKVFFLEKLSGVFVRTSHGIIVYMIKNSGIKSNRVILQIRSETGSIFSLTEKDLPPGSLLWVKQSQIVLSGQIVAQGAQIKTSKQQFPESLHPVQSPIGGEIFFERMQILQILTSKQDDKKSIKKRQNTETGLNISNILGSLGKNWRLNYPNPNPIVSQIGSFWILSGAVQKEYHTGKIFLRSGDLVSKKTPFSQYNFHLSQLTKVQTKGSKLTIGFTYLNFEVSSIRFFKMGYFLSPTSSCKNLSTLFNGTLKSNQRNTDLLFYKKISEKNLKKDSVIWFPSRFNTKFPGYFSYLSHSFPISPSFSKKNGLALRINGVNSYGIKLTKSEKDSLISSFRINDINASEGKGNFLWSKHVLFFINQFPQKYFKKIFIFNNQKTFFKTTGILQVQITSNQKVQIKNLWVSAFARNRKFRTNLRQTSFFISVTRNFLLRKLYSFSFPITQNNQQKQSPLPSLLIKKAKTWLFISPKNTNKSSLQVFSLTLEIGKSFNKTLFSSKLVNLAMIHSNCLQLLPYSTIQKKSASSTKIGRNELDHLVSLKASTQNYVLKEEVLNSQTTFLTDLTNWYNVQDFLVNVQISLKFQEYAFTTKKVHFKKQFSKKFIFYVLVGRINTVNSLKTKTQIQNDRDSHQTGTRYFPVKTISCLGFGTPQRKLYKIEGQTNFVLAGDFCEFFIPEKKSFFETSFFVHSFDDFLSISSPFTTKQLPTHSIQKKTPKTDVQLVIPSSPTYLSTRSLLQLQFTLIFDSNYSLKISHNSLFSYKKQSFSLSAIEFFLYDDLILKNMFQFTYETFPSNLMTLNKTFTKGFLKIKNTGEFRRYKQTQKQITMSILENHNMVTLLFPSYQVNELTTLIRKCFWNNKKIGDFIRWGDIFEENYGFHQSGEILKLTSKTIVLRTGIPLLASSRGILHIFHNDLIQKNQLLLTLKSRRFQTEDIVQGIPKIEQLFEARRTQGGERVRNSVHIKLQRFFFLALHSSPLNEAVLESVKRIQKFLIENILEAYSNQGVKISEKHVEIIVRQMTNRVRIIDGGDTGFLSGELVHLTWIQKINKNLQLSRYRQATYEPLVLGITKSVLQSESFLLAASFQEVSRVLVRSALTNKSDFLRGLHEKVILGQRIPAGTGLFPRPKRLARSKFKFELPG